MSSGQQPSASSVPLRFENFFSRREERELELQLYVVLTRGDFDRIHRDFKWDERRKYLETKFDGRLKKRIGYKHEHGTNEAIAFVSWKHTHSSQLHAIHVPEFFLTHPPVVVRSSLSTEYTRYSELQNAEKLHAKEVVVWVARVGNVEYRVGIATDLRNLANEFFFQVEEEFSSKDALDKSLDTLHEQWDFSFMRKVEPVLLPPLELPSRAPSIHFTHSTKPTDCSGAPTKPKIDGIRFIALRDHRGWCCIYDEDVSTRDAMLRSLSFVPDLPVDYIYMFEYISDGRSVLIEVLAARCTPLYRNTLHHETYGSNQVDERQSTVQVDLTVSRSMLVQLDDIGCVTNVHMDSVASKNIPTDGLLRQCGKSSYMKVKSWHTIELFYDGASLYTSESEFIPLVYQILDPGRILCMRGIYEFKVDHEASTLSAIKARPDKCIPDSFSKVFSIISSSHGV